MLDLLFTQDIGKLKFFARVKSTRHHIGSFQYVFVKETTSLRDHATFIIARAKLSFDEVEVPDDLILGDLCRVFLIVISDSS